MIACLDVHYGETRACAAAIIAEDWSARHTASEHVALVETPDAYRSGKFYQRELRPLLAVIGQITDPIDTYIIDAYCYLSVSREPGLGAFLHTALDGRVVVVGVAKNRYRGTQHALEVLRGESKRPLFVTSVGLPCQEAAARVRAMAGRTRLPTLLKAADRLARDRLPAG